jgi:predicted enzyme related to lactoylglutathione lyase
MFGNNFVHANFSVDDLGVAKDFYINKLGFKMGADIGGMEIVLLAGSGTKIHLYQKDNHQASNATVLGIEVADVKSTINGLAEKGVNVDKNIEGVDENGIMSDPALGEAAWFKDPAGNWVCVHHFTSD